MARKKHFSFTLIELLVAFTLLASLLFFLFQFYTQILLSRLELEPLKQQVHSRHVLQARLSQVFFQIHPAAPFYTTKSQESEAPMLVFTFDNGINRNPSLCGLVKGTLFLNHERQLSFLIENTLERTKDKLPAKEQEILLEKVDSLKLAFLHPETGQWLFSWDKGALFCPRALKLILTQTGEQKASSERALEFGFGLPHEPLFEP